MVSAHSSKTLTKTTPLALTYTSIIILIIVITQLLYLEDRKVWPLATMLALERPEELLCLSA